MANLDDVDTNLQKINDQFKHRRVQIEQLFHYLNQLETHNIVVYGPRATCKSSVVRTLMRQFGMFYAWIDVLTQVNVRSIYECILMQVKAHLLAKCDSENFATIEALDTNCTNSVTFIEKLRPYLIHFGNWHSVMTTNIYHRKFVIVLDHVDDLFKEEYSELVYLMNNLERLSRRACSISVLYIGAHSTEWYMRQCDFRLGSLQVHFQNYTNDELMNLLSARVPHNFKYSDDFYANYVNIIIKSLSPFTRNFVELQNICLMNIDRYTKPIEDLEMTIRDSGKLYFKFQPRLQEIIESITDHKLVHTKTAIVMSPSMNYLLVAAYLASCNSSKSDKRIFMRNQGRKKIRKRKQNKVCLELEAKPPKAFTLERVTQIYRALVHLNEHDCHRIQQLFVSTLIYQQFIELIKQNLIMSSKAGTNSVSILSVAKYQLSDIVTNKYITEVAATIRLNLKAFVENK